MEIVPMKNEIHYSESEMQLLLHWFGIPVSKPSSLAEHARWPGPHPKEITVCVPDGDKQQQKVRGGRMAGNCSCMSMKAQGLRVNISVAVTSFSVKTTGYLQGKMNVQRINKKSTIKWLHHNYWTLKDKTMKILVLITFAILAYKVYWAAWDISILRDF